MKHNVCHLLILPLLLCGIIAGCMPVKSEAAAVSGATGEIHILKTDITGLPLKDARYRIAREATEQELRDSDVEKALLTVGKENLTVVWCSFWDNGNLMGEKTDVFSTDEDGKGSACALPYGTYYLVETRAPGGYRRMEEPVRFRVNKYSHLTQKDQVYDDAGKLIDNTIHIITVGFDSRIGGRVPKVFLTAGISGLIFSVSTLILLLQLRWRRSLGI